MNKLIRTKKREALQYNDNKDRKRIKYTEQPETLQGDQGHEGMIYTTDQHIKKKDFISDVTVNPTNLIF